MGLIKRTANDVQKYRENKPVKIEDVTPGCVDGKRIIIVNGETYYAGTVNTWGDVETIKCK